MSRRGHVPVRLCIGCKKRKKKEELVRFILTADGSVRVVEGKNKTGRGAYVCQDASCLKLAKKRRYFEPLPETGGFKEGFKQKSIEGEKKESKPF